MASVDLDRLIKYLNLSTSDQDGEALTAIRYANSTLKKANLTWQELLSRIFEHGRSQGRKDVEAEQVPEEQSLEELFAEMLNAGRLTTGEFSFVSSLSEFYDAKGYLTDKQVAALERIKKRYGYV